MGQTVGQGRKRNGLTVKQVGELTRPGRYSDGNGLYLHVRSGGSKQWIVRYTAAGHKRRDISIGPADAVSLADARIEAHEIRKAIRAGDDPIDQRKRDDSEHTFEKVADEVWLHNRPSWRNPKHADQWINTLRSYAFPVIGKCHVADVTSDQIIKILLPIWLSKHETASRVRQRMNVVFDWSIVKGLRKDANPVQGVARVLPKRRRQVRHFPALPWRQLPGFYAALAEQTSVSAFALRFAILTAARSGEVRHAEWSEIDVERRLWTVPAVRMKMGRQHRVPLSDEAITVLRCCEGLHDRLVFPSPHTGKPQSDMAFGQLLKRMGHSDITAHGFRSTFRDWCSEAGDVPWEVAEQALAHQRGDATERAYARSDLLDQRRRTMAAWARFAISKK